MIRAQKGESSEGIDAEWSLDTSSAAPLRCGNRQRSYVCCAHWTVRRHGSRRRDGQMHATPNRRDVLKASGLLAGGAVAAAAFGVRPAAAAYPAAAPAFTVLTAARK